MKSIRHYYVLIFHELGWTTSVQPQHMMHTHEYISISNEIVIIIKIATFVIIVSATVKVILGPRVPV